ncbi:uncharacterized protein LOC144452628 isoform X2 [Glandiceps talaboti]
MQSAEAVCSVEAQHKALRRQIKQANKTHVEERSKNCKIQPLVFLHVVFGLTLISLGILEILFECHLYFLGTPIWCGILTILFMLLSVVIAILSSMVLMPVTVVAYINQGDYGQMSQKIVDCAVIAVALAEFVVAVLSVFACCYFGSCDYKPNMYYKDPCQNGTSPVIMIPSTDHNQLTELLGLNKQQLQDTPTEGRNYWLVIPEHITIRSTNGLNSMQRIGRLPPPLPKDNQKSTTNCRDLLPTTGT